MSTATDPRARLAEMRRQVAAATQARARAEGELSSTMARLKREFHVDTIPAAADLRDRMTVDLEKAEKKLATDVAALGQGFEWSPTP